MFTGIISHLGKIASHTRQDQGARIAIAVPDALLAATEIGASIAVNGCCLTLAEKNDGIASFDLSPETLARTAALAAEQMVHMEASLKAGDSIDGHLIFGHIDGTARLQNRQERGQALRLVLQAPDQCALLIAEKGSVAVAGVSLTVASCQGSVFAVELVPHTIAQTVLAQLKVGDEANFEADMLARYAARAIEKD